MKKTISTFGWLSIVVVALSFAFFFSDDVNAGSMNLDKSGVAIQGHDPVAFFADGKAVKGNPAISSSHNGAKYHFASADHQMTFEKNPEKYEPEFGGWCAYGVAKGSKVKINPEAFQIVDGRLLLQYSKGVRKKFNKDTQGNLEKADKKWPEVSKK